MEYSINDNLNSTAIISEIQHQIEYLILNNKNPFNGKFNIQRNIKYSITKINSTAIQQLFNGNSTTIQWPHNNIWITTNFTWLNVNMNNNEYQYE